MPLTSADLVINETFFNNLWPLILDENICDTRSKNDSPYFRPRRKFDALWAHGFLASKDYGDYETPVKFYCPPCNVHGESNSEHSLRRGRPIELDTDEGMVCEFKGGASIKTLDQQFETLAKEKRFREKLASDFKDRKGPWYIPCCRMKSDIINDIQFVFTNPMERQLFRAIHLFECKFIVINLGAYLCITHLDNWMKYCKYVKIIVVIRNAELVEQLQRLSTSLHPVMFQDICENTWQQELTRSLNAAIKYAYSTQIMNNCSAPFVYVFSSHSDIDCLNKFKVLRKT